MTVKIAHEAPLSVFPLIEEFTDYNYCLVHMLDKSEEYMETFLSSNNEIILDNSIFELGEAYDEDLYLGWINKLHPDWYIIPDVLNDFEGTFTKLINWTNSYGKFDISPDIKRIGVCQGNSTSELIQCYVNIAPFVDKVAISFDSAAYTNENYMGNHWLSLATGRVKFLNELIRYIDQHDNVIEKPLHLLGVGNPYFELPLYKQSPVYDLIDSIDTSHPVMMAMHGRSAVDELYTVPLTSWKKPVGLMADVMDEWQPMSMQERFLILSNISIFRSLING